MINLLPRGRAFRFLLVPALVTGLAMGGYAYTAANTVENTKAGDGSGTITGYDISSVDYTLNGTNPAIIDAVDFTLDSEPVAGSDLKIKLIAAGTTWYDCTWLVLAVTCDTTSPAVTVLAVDQLRVIIAD